MHVYVYRAVGLENGSRLQRHNFRDVFPLSVLYKTREKKLWLKIVSVFLSFLIIICGFIVPRQLKNIYNEGITLTNSIFMKRKTTTGGFIRRAYRQRLRPFRRHKQQTFRRLEGSCRTFPRFSSHCHLRMFFQRFYRIRERESTR